ncbi:Protein IMPACT [Seminavis robusta]|uniref:Protein IMPACT n=1 Tax=Seminavis robusta TaxID=568900 RepID=A0A9N8H3V6_9STRA|nr:Protein IMPACT [Seminavis robusta]|eukprot:Sro97_g050170.1 Protein IMPACT (316) ;mRNA; f:107014-107961
MGSDANADDDDDGDDGERREEELEALFAVYGDKLVLGDLNDDELSKHRNGPWKIRVANKVTLELLLPVHYPSREAPTPRIHAPYHILNATDARAMQQELIDMYSPDTEVAILWAEHCRTALQLDDEQFELDVETEVENEEENPPNNSAAAEGTRAFYPSSAKFGQTIRRFDTSTVLNDKNQRTIFHGAPFHPPKSGPAELFIAHVASVESMAHVEWVLAELLFNDKKVAKASHNMMAYRFVEASTGCEVSDNDDDGEKGSGAKLAALLDLSNANNVIVVVSRWYGGVHLGPARFKYIASTARDVLEEHGFLPKKK